MNDFSDILTPGTVVAGLSVSAKKQLFQQLAALAEKNGGIDARVVIERLSERERLGSTGFGGGVAIPHGKIEGLGRVVGVFARLDQPIDFQAIDDMPVDIVFMLLSPPDAGAEHLKALARVSRALRDRPFLAKLRGAGSDDALYALLVSAEARDAA
ncbi:PTS IIA-like nitrogen regulatory protein PtsN [Sphingomonas colocasiae]|uniref:PTS IIA-like nitrogen regulatory protein PtsN n=1 Tax=Sphingomonas colocasiae TaxID=1848973 RepID=A0ABS7PXM0_9SPHN|nr:PTS IIA-like nitrogen regulatory protein PtsN [Sphingomonas colocasiae]MBY8824714.1 PTS IIA-like nitrogen regulatory protein PtsN [Sphingomonas colocasiae]